MPLFEYDIFLSYAHLDNPEMTNWVDHFKSDLNNVFKGVGNTDGLNIWKDKKNINTGESIKSKIQDDGLKSSRLLVPILSLNYLSRPYCCYEFVEFLSLIGWYNRDTNTFADLNKMHPVRIVPVMKYPLETGNLTMDDFDQDHIQHIEIIQSFIAHTELLFEQFFYEEDGIYQTWSRGKDEYTKKITKLSNSISEHLKSTVSEDDNQVQIESVEARKGIFVAISPNFSDERKRLVNELKRSFTDYTIYPDDELNGGPIDYTAYGASDKEVEPKIYSYLEKCSFSIHLIKDTLLNYYDKIQLELASRFYESPDRKFISLVNAMKSLKNNSDSAAYFDRLAKETFQNLVLRENQNMNDFKKIIFDHINIWQEELKDAKIQSANTAKKSGNKKYVYVTHAGTEPKFDPQSEITQLRDKLKNQEIYVTFSDPDFDENLEKEQIIASDGVIVYHGDETNGPCLMKQLNIRKYVAEKNTLGFAKGLFLDDPQKDLKNEKFKGTDYQLINSGKIPLDQEIEGFINDLNE